MDLSSTFLSSMWTMSFQLPWMMVWHESGCLLFALLHPEGFASNEGVNELVEHDLLTLRISKDEPSQRRSGNPGLP